MLITSLMLPHKLRKQLEAFIMEPIYQQTFDVDGTQVDRFCRLKTANLLAYIQQVSGKHSDLMGYSWAHLDELGMLWAVVRHRVQISRLPMEGERVTLETWPCPTTRVAFPRSVIGRDQAGEELFRSISLWVFMNRDTRAMILPRASGVEIQGLTRGLELDSPGSLCPAKLSKAAQRPVRYSDLDKNGHMNNTRYLEWAEDLLPSAFHRDHPLRELVICYLSEAREGQLLDLEYDLSDGPTLRLDIHRDNPETTPERVCALRAVYG